mgnify:CR=1 FL=1
MNRRLADLGLIASRIRRNYIANVRAKMYELEQER